MHMQLARSGPGSDASSGDVAERQVAANQAAPDAGRRKAGHRTLLGELPPAAPPVRAPAWRCPDAARRRPAEPSAAAGHVREVELLGDLQALGSQLGGPPRVAAPCGDHARDAAGTRARQYSTPSRLGAGEHLLEAPSRPHPGAPGAGATCPPPSWAASRSVSVAGCAFKPRARAAAGAHPRPRRASAAVESTGRAQWRSALAARGTLGVRQRLSCASASGRGPCRHGSAKDRTRPTGGSARCAPDRRPLRPAPAPAGSPPPRSRPAGACRSWLSASARLRTRRG